MILEQRIQNYVERFYLTSGMTTWPDIRQIAKGLGVGMQKTFDCIEGDERCTTQGWNVEPVDFRELEVYTSTDKIEEIWNELHDKHHSLAVTLKRK
jgi:hypothetical protein